MNTSVQIANERFKGMMERKLQEGPKKAEVVLRSLELEKPIDYLVSPKNNNWELDLKKSGFLFRTPDVSFHLSNNALSQLRLKIGAPTVSYLNKLISTGREELALDILKSHLRVEGREKRFLFRSVKSGEHLTTHGILSDSFLPLDSLVLANHFIEKVQEGGAIITDAYWSRYVFTIDAFIPKILEPVPGEYVLLGVRFRNGDYGTGALSISLIIWRLVCTNMATAMNALRRVHIGGRLGEGLDIQSLSPKTIQLATDALTSSFQDAIKMLLDPKTLGKAVERIETMSRDRLTLDRAKDIFNKVFGARSTESREALRMFEDDGAATAELVTAPKTVYKAAQIISYHANETKDVEKMVTWQEEAGKLYRLN